MNPNDLKQVLEALQQADVREFNLKTSEYELHVKRGIQAAVHSSSSAPVEPSSVPQTPAAPLSVSVVPAALPVKAEPKPSSTAVPVKAPIVGTFYASPSPDKPAFVQEGDRVQKGQVLCILEAMKLMNEIESEVAGVVSKVLVANGSPVEYGQDLFLIETA
jgi:acetyl-CoA carboxylase biotin carboxyl carrier protein